MVDNILEMKDDFIDRSYTDQETIDAVKQSLTTETIIPTKKNVIFGNLFDNSIVGKFSTSGLSLILTNTLLAPLERIKTVLQTNSIARFKNNALKTNSSIDIFSEIAKNQGVQGMYRANLANIYKYSLQSFFKIYLYEKLKLESNILKSSESEFWANLGTSIAINLA